ncbi:LamG domain-containing protein [Candidatus Poribacteria bacterium]
MKYQCSIVFVCLIFTMFSVAITMADLTEGLVAHWPLDEVDGNVAVDASGNGHDGTLDNNGPEWTDDSKIGTGALSLDGVDDVVSIGSFDVVDGSGITIAGWFFMNDLGDDPRLVSKTTAGATDAHWYMLGVKSSENKLRFRLKTGGVTGDLKGGTIETEVWIHAAAVWDGSTMSLYKNGVEVGSLNKGGALDVDPKVEMAIGNQPPASGDAAPFNGIIDDVAIWNRALTLEEINGLMVTGIPAAAVEPIQKLTTTWGAIKH